jgi:hypothetical protein
MKAVQFTNAMLRFDKKGEKTGWTYVEIPIDIAQALKPGNKKEFKVKGKIDDLSIKRVSLLPMGGGKFIMPVNAKLRKAIGKRHGAMVKLQLTEDQSEFIFNKDFLECLNDEPAAKIFFSSLPGSHQRYFSKWIDEAKTDQTKTKRIALAVTALSKGSDYGKMLREAKKEKE